MVSYEIFSKTKVLVIVNLSFLEKFSKPCISFPNALSVLNFMEIDLRVTLAGLKTAGNIPMEKDKLHITARCLDIWLWTRNKTLVEILLGKRDLLIMEGDIILPVLSLLVAVTMKDPLFFVNKKLLNDLLENLIFWLSSLSNWCWKVIERIWDCNWVTDVFFIIPDYGSYAIIAFCFIETRDLIPTPT